MNSTINQKAQPGSVQRSVTRHNVSVELTAAEVIDLRMLRFELVKMAKQWNAGKISNKQLAQFDTF